MTILTTLTYFFMMRTVSALGHGGHVDSTSRQRNSEFAPECPRRDRLTTSDDLLEFGQALTLLHGLMVDGFLLQAPLFVEQLAKGSTGRIATAYHG